MGHRSVIRTMMIMVVVVVVCVVLRATVLVLLSSGASASPDNASSGRSQLEQIWIYRHFDGISPPRPGTMFCVIADGGEPGARNLVVANEELLSPAHIERVVAGRISKTDSMVLYYGAAPSRENSFHRWDVDGDGTDEVLLTGREGAGGTSFVSIFRVSKNGVTRLFEDASRFGFWLLDSDGDRRYEIANAGFEFRLNRNSDMEEKEFRIYVLAEDVGEFVEARKVLAKEFVNMVEALDEVKGAPIRSGNAVGIIRIAKKSKAGPDR